MNRLLASALVLGMTGAAAPAQEDYRASLVSEGVFIAHEDPGEVSPEEVFLEAWRVVKNAFYDEKMHGVDWEAVRDELLPRAKGAGSAAELSGVINEALGRLKASHTAHYHRGQREYYEVLDVFNPEGVPRRSGSKIRPGPVTYVGIGVATKVIDGKVFAADVYDGGPGAEAGILAGDELVGVEDGAWSDIEAFADREGEETRVRIRRRDGGKVVALSVVPRRIRPREMFVESIGKSARLIEKDGRVVAYVRVRSYASTLYQEALREVLETEFSEARREHPEIGLVFDIRGGWGGAQARYLEIFNTTVPRVALRSREGQVHEQRQAWDPKANPVVMLVDGGSRSGKEILAYGFKRARVGTLMGERTAGAVLAGTLRPLADGSVLYVAVADVEVEGERIEGKGVEPHVVVERRLPYSSGDDAQIDAAVEWLLKERK
jgi:carboxyl-terminal processing protease